MGKWAFDLFGALAFELVFEEGEARRRLEREREIRKKNGGKFLRRCVDLFSFRAFVLMEIHVWFELSKVRWIKPYPFFKKKITMGVELFCLPSNIFGFTSSDVDGHMIFEYSTGANCK